MDWNKISGNISKAVEVAQSMGEKAMEFSSKAVKSLDSIKSASEIVKGEDSLIDKGTKLVGLVNTSFTETVDIPDSITEDVTASQPNGLVEMESGQASSLLPALESSTDAVTALALMGTEIAKTIQVCQIEETKRAEINAHMEIEVARINAISKLLSDYLNKTFDERAELFDNYFDVLDKAIASGDSQLMAATLGSINSLAASSPFKDLADLNKVSSMLSEGGEWDI